MAKKLDIWSPGQIEICTEYAKGNDAKVIALLSNNKDALGFVDTIMKDKLGNDLLRERIIAKVEDLDHSCTMHDYDAQDPRLIRPAEIKSEQHSTLDGRQYQVTGGGAFGSIEDDGGVHRLIADNPIMHMNAFIDGRLVYNVAFNFNDSSISTRLFDTVARRKAGAKTAPKFMWSDWAYAKSLEVTYFSEFYYLKLFPYASADLMSRVKRVWKLQQEKIADSIMEELLTPQIVNIVLPVPDSVPESKIDSTLQTTTLCNLENAPLQTQDPADKQPTFLCDLS